MCIAVGLMSAALAACTPVLPTRSGFLTDYTQLRTVPTHPPWQWFSESPLDLCATIWIAPVQWQVPATLAVESQDVVPAEAQAIDRGLAGQTHVRPMPVVAMKPVG